LSLSLSASLSLSLSEDWIDGVSFPGVIGIDLQSYRTGPGIIKGQKVDERSPVSSS
jgi:hypothetical protein